MPPVNTKRRRAIEPIRYDELMSNAGMSGFVPFLEIPAPHEATPAEPHLVGRMPSKVLKQGRIRKAIQAEDGHSLAEQAVYEALWQAAVPVDDHPDAGRSIRIGYHRLGQLARLSWVSVKANLRSLEKKLAIEVTGSENSATREGKCYLVHSRASILERRQRAGLEWVRRTRGVELLSLANLTSGRPGPKAVT